ncbi:hypothetical protein ACI2JA_04165 [Alkalihalobacillus sp. NPDC078783]
MLITAGVNHGASLSELNAGILSLQKKVKKLDLGLSINKAELSTFNKLTKEFNKINKEAINTKRVIESALLPDGTRVNREYFGGLKGEFAEIVQRANQTSDSMKKSSGHTNEVVKQTKALNLELNKTYELTKRTTTENAKGARTTTEAYKSAQTGLTQTLKLNQHGEVVQRKVTNNVVKQNSEREKALRYEQQVRNNIEKNRQAEERKTKELQQQLRIYQQQAALNAQNIRRTHGTHVDNTGLNNYLNSVNNLNARTPNLTHQMQNLNMEFRKLSGNAKEAAGATMQAGMSVGESLKTALTKFPLWIGNKFTLNLFNSVELLTY